MNRHRWSHELWIELSQNRTLQVGVVLISVLALFLLGTPALLHLQPLEPDYGALFSAPSAQHLFGTDDLGRDLLARVVFGGYTSMLIGLEVMILTTVFGTVVGLFTGYFDRLDMVAMRMMDVQMSFPALLLAIAILAILGNNPNGVVIALSIVYGPRTARVVRGQVLSLREEDYVASAVAVGGSTWRVLFLHILPGVIPALVVQETFLFAYAILGEAGLSFVGVGIMPPAPSWGNIMGDARTFIKVAPWMMLFPGFAIMLAVLALNLLGDGLREALNPHRIRTDLQETA